MSLRTSAIALLAVLFLAFTASPARGEGIAVPSFPAREGVADEVAARFMDALRRALVNEGLRVDEAHVVTPGIAGSLEIVYAELVAQLARTRYAVLGQVVLRETGEGPYAVDLIAVDAVQGRSTDLGSRTFDLATLEAAAGDLAVSLAAFAAPVADLPAGDADLFVTSQPSGAEVRINGVLVGLTGSVDPHSLQPGRYEVELRLEGYLPEVRSLDLRSGDFRFLRIELTEIAGGSLLVASRPRAEVWLNGELVGTTPANLPASPGEHVVELRRPGFVSRSQVVLVRLFRATRVDERLEPIGEPMIFWPLDAPVRVLVDSILTGGGFAVVEPGLHTIEVLRGGQVYSWLRAVPELGVFRLDLETGELIPLDF